MSSTASPQPETMGAPPPVAPKPLASKPVGTMPKLSASKVYVLPPRPKPGRKPSADVPPNKRKAQNREAQRAFRERKAQQVSDLECRLQQLEDSFRAREVNLNLTIRQLQKDKEQLQDQLRSVHIQLAKANSTYQVASPAPSVHELDAAFDKALEERLPSRRSSESLVGPTTQHDETCGICTKDDCVCEQIGLRERRSSGDSNGSIQSGSGAHIPPWKPVQSPLGLLGSPMVEFSRQTASERTPPSTNPLKRKLEDMPRAPTPPPRRNSETEIDFTAMYARPTKSKKESPLKRMSVPRDKCGFCVEGTPCVCAENSFAEENTLPPLILSPEIQQRGVRDKLPTLLPGLSIEVPSQGPPPGECSGDPGSCSLCQTDPMSTLFCTSLASRPSTTPANGTFIPASAAYQTLSRHQGFSRADFGTIIGKLQSRGTYVEVNSVANVLRELDRKFHQ